MQTYVFQRKDGTTFEADLDVDDAPAIGETRRFGRFTARRLAIAPQLQKPPEWGHKAYMLDPWAPGAPRYASDGQPVFHTQKEIREFEAQSGRTFNR